DARRGGVTQGARGDDARRHGPRAPAAGRLPRYLPLDPGDRVESVTDGAFDFTDDQIERYSRHIALAEIGPQGQRKLNNSGVLVLGAGGLGAPVAMYLAASRVGTLGIIDYDHVDLSNLQRQIIHPDSARGEPKAEVARMRAQELNPDIDVVAHDV